MPIVVDNSVFVACCMRDEENPAAIRIMQRVAEEGGVAPRIWWYELRNVLLVNERRGRISKQQVSATLEDSLALGIVIDDGHEEGAVLALSRQRRLSVYDAAYLEVALRRGLPLATLDRRLQEAAEITGVAVIRG